MVLSPASMIHVRDSNFDLFSALMSCLMTMDTTNAYHYLEILKVKYLRDCWLSLPLYDIWKTVTAYVNVLLGRRIESFAKQPLYSTTGLLHYSQIWLKWHFYLFLALDNLSWLTNPPLIRGSKLLIVWFNFTGKKEVQCIVKSSHLEH